MIRRLIETDAQEVAGLIATTLRTTNAQDYSHEYIERKVKKMNPEYVSKWAEWTHRYAYTV